MTNFSERSKKSAVTRKKNNPDAFKKMGSLGGAKSSSRPFRTQPGLAKRASLRAKELHQRGGLAYEPLDTEPPKEQ